MIKKLKIFIIYLEFILPRLSIYWNGKDSQMITTRGNQV